MSKKPLSAEIDQTKNTISQQMSHQKTTLKEYVAYFKDAQSILRNSIGDIVKLSRRQFTCREYENNTLKQLLDSGVMVNLKLSDIMGQYADTLQIIETSINVVYLEIREKKENIMNKLVDGIKKERDHLYEKQIKDPSIKVQMEQFCEKALEQMGQLVVATQQCERTKNKIIIDNIKICIDEYIKSLDLSKGVLKEFADLITNLPLDEPPVLQKQKSSLQTKSLSNKDIQQKQVVQDKNLLTDHKTKLMEIKKKYNKSFITSVLPAKIREQIGIFNSEMPLHLDIAKEFSQQDFYMLILLLMMQYKSQHQEWNTFVTHTKNKFKITMTQFKCLENFKIQLENEENDILASPFLLLQNGIFKNITITEPSMQKFRNKLILFVQTNEFWSQYFLNIIFNSQMQKKREEFLNQFKNSISKLIFEEQEFQTIQLLRGSDITYPMNQCLLEVLLTVIIDQNAIDLDFLPLLQKFGQDVLRLSPAHTCITLLSLVYIKIIQPTLRQKNLEIAETLKSLQIEELWNVISHEKSIDSSQVSKALKQKNGEKLFNELTQLLRSFWSQLPSEGEFLKQFAKLFYFICHIQQEFTGTKSIQDLLAQIMQATGNDFYTMIMKKDQINFNQITDHTIQQISKLIPLLCTEAKELKTVYLKPIAQGLSQYLQEEQQNIEAFLFRNFFQGMVEDLLIIYQQLDICQTNKLIPEDKSGCAFVICYQIAIVDEEMSPYNIMHQILEQIGTSLEVWFQTTQIKTFEVLHQCIVQERFLEESLSFKQQMEQKQTKYIEDFCSLLFKSIESLQQVFQLSEQSEFKKLVFNRMETILYHSVLMYLESLETNVRDWCNSYYNWFIPQSKNQMKYQVDNQKVAQTQVHLCIGMMMRICNINFIQQQLEHMKQQHNFKLIQNLDNDFSTKGKSICKYVSTILCNDLFQQTIFVPIYQDLKILTDAKEYCKSEWSIQSQLIEIKDFFTIFNQKLPTSYLSVFYDQFFPQFFQSIYLKYILEMYFALIDINKLQNVNQHIYSQVICLEINELIKFFQKIITNNVIVLRIKECLTDITEVAMWFDQNNKELIQNFENYNFQNNKQKAAGIYRILMLRKSDSKVKEILKKYQKVFE